MPNYTNTKIFYPNQRRIETHKKFKDGKLEGAGGSMVVAYWDDICHVMRITKNSVCVLLWEYFFKNEDGYVVGLSTEEIKISLGIGKRACDTAISILIATGFLKQKEGTKTGYDFIPYPWEE